MIHPRQIRGARGLLGLNQGELAERSGVSVATIKRLENSGPRLHATVDTILRIQSALEAEGIVFIDADGTQGIGVRLKDPDTR